jgi:hypothetical protein
MEITNDLTIPSNLTALRERVEKALDFADPDQIDNILCAVLSAEKLAKDIKAMAFAAAMEFIKENSPDGFTVNGRRYYISTGKKQPPKCKDAKATLPAMFELTGGDLDAVAECLSSNAWKQGSTKAVLESIGKGDQFEKLFETKPKEKLMIDGPTNPEDEGLQIVETKWIKKKPAANVVLLPDTQTP